MASGFDEASVGDQSGRVFVVTGANSGIGFEAARVLAEHGGRVVLACRSVPKAEAARDRILARAPGADVLVRDLDLASLASVRAFAERFLAEEERLDVLVNNAGVMAIPRRETADGFEMQLGTNHFGHFALTGLLLPRVIASAPSRVVTVSSAVHQRGRMAWDDLDGRRSYASWGAYFQSKLANLLFCYELGRRLARAGHDVTSVACHPGYAATGLQEVGPRMRGGSAMGVIMQVGNATIAQDARGGALPTLYAAVAPGVESGDYVGPGDFFGLRGAPRKGKSSRRSRDEADARRLWELSVARTGVDPGL